MKLATFYGMLGYPSDALLDKRIFKKMVLEHGQLTAADRRALSEDVVRLTWKYTLKASTVQVRPYEDDEREYLEVAVIEAELSGRKRATRLAEMLQRAIPYPVLLVLADEHGLSISVAHKRFSLADKGSIIAADFLCTPWLGSPSSEIDSAFCEALSFHNLPQSDFLSLYSGMVRAVLARNAAELTGRFSEPLGRSEEDQRKLLEECHSLERELARLRVAIRKEERFAEQVELNTRINELEGRLDEAKASL